MAFGDAPGTPGKAGMRLLSFQLRAIVHKIQTISAGSPFRGTVRAIMRLQPLFHSWTLKAKLIAVGLRGGGPARGQRGTSAPSGASCPRPARRGRLRVHALDRDHFALYLLDVCNHGVGPRFCPCRP
jgi:hypothetical protein